MAGIVCPVQRGNIMEQKKTLWIIAAVGAFLLVVLGAAGLVYSPAKNTSPTIASVAPVTKHNNNTDSGWTNTPATTTNQEATAPAPVVIPENTLAASKVDEMVVVSENTTVYGMDQQQKPAETTIDLNALKSELAASNSVTTPVQVPVQPQNINITVTLPEAEKPQQVVPVQQSQPVKIVEKVQKEEPTPIKVSSSKTTVSSVKEVEKKSQPKPATAVTKPAPKKVTQYWVQVASYSNKKGAENARSILDENKITSDIFTYRDNKDKLYFRVRVGPYTTKSEAEYWQARIMKIPYFAKNDSYITSTTK